MADGTISVLVSDKLAQEGIDVLKSTSGVSVTVKTGLSPEELKKELPKHDAIIIRSATRLTAEVLACAPNLRAIARAGVGVDNIDIPAASKNGTIVMNTPGGNTISTAELTMTMMLGLCRHIHPACEDLKKGVWERKKYEGTEVNGKTIGILGLGRIGCEVAKRSAGFNMRVIGYDPLMSVDKARSMGIEMKKTVPEVVREADFITVHTPLNDETRGIINAAMFSIAKKGVRVINCARGGIIDEAALLDALNNGQCAGAALDVFTTEPPTDRRLVEHPKVLCTPHLGASTEEAQITVAVDAAHQIIDALQHGDVRFAVNFPALSGKDAKALAPFGRLANRMGALAGQLVEGQISAVRIVYGGEIAARDLRGVTMQFTMGLMKQFEEAVNPVSAPILARERGIGIDVTTSADAQDYTSLIRVQIDSSGGTRTLVGTIFGKDAPRIVQIDGYYMEVFPEGRIILVTNNDKPGTIGDIGHALGHAGINIALMTFGRKDVAAGGQAMAVLNLDVEAVPETLIKAIEKLPNVTSVKALSL